MRCIVETWTSYSVQMMTGFVKNDARNNFTSMTGKMKIKCRNDVLNKVCLTHLSKFATNVCRKFDANVCRSTPQMLTAKLPQTFGRNLIFIWKPDICQKFAANLWQIHRNCLLETLYSSKDSACGQSKLLFFIWGAIGHELLRSCPTVPHYLITPYPV